MQRWAAFDIVTGVAKLTKLHRSLKQENNSCESPAQDISPEG